ncbi:TPA: SDR family NAD(P)-dependent oxidoreductase [Escherichia coli]
MDNLRFSSAPTADSIDASIVQHYPDCEPVAVIGYACHFPESPDGETFWQNLLEGRECSRRFTREELLAVGLDVAIIDDPHYVNIGTVLDNADCFDATLFGYSRQEAESMDPQQRLFLQAVWHALEHAGYAPGAVPHKTGVFASSRMSTYPGREALNVTEVAQVKGLQSLMGNDKDYIATRAAYKLNLHGPALSVQTACSSSLVAVHLACESLRAGESDMAVAGGVALSFPQQAGYRYQPGMIFSPDGHCRPFDASAEGTWAGNGLGCVVLRRLRDALLSGDPIISVILSSAVNNDGNRKVGYTAPSVAGQQAVIEEALMLAAIDDRQVGYIETHGTGTPLGDAIEIEALRNVYAPRPQDRRCALGSVKSNMGHLDTAAGIAGLLKTVLAVSRGQIPPLLNFHTPNPALKLEESPFTVPVSAQAWQDEMRYAGVSSFGIGGTNCHMIVASLPDALNARLPNTDGGRKSTALLLSAASDSALRRLATDYAGALRKNADASDLAFTALHARRLDLPFRLAVPLNRETADALSTWASEKSGAQVYSGHGASGKQVWLFTGQGSHWRTMGQTMYQHSTAFADTLDRCFSACSEMLMPSLREAMFNPDSAQLDNMAWAQPAIVAFEIAMAAHWRAEGLKPDFAIGHSVGEFAAAVVCGHYTIEQVMPLVCRRGALMQQCASGAMVAVFADEDTLMQSASDGVEVLYQEFSFGRYFNQIAAGVLRGIVQTRQPRQPLRILEVGGGTGGTTAWLLPELNGVPALEYHFTDISALFTRRAQQKFADYDFVKYSELDLEKEAQSQGFQAQSYDLIVAANVIHATRHIGRTLDNLRPLLKPGGRLLMREITQPMRLFDFVFGPLVLPLQDLDAREGELFLTTAQWQQQCRHAGFSKVAWLPQDGSPTAGMSEHIILATLPGQAVSAVTFTAPSEPVLGQALTDNGDYLADWSDCAGQPERFNARWQEAWRLLSQRHGDALPVEPPPVAAPEWLGKVRLSWQNEAFSRGQMRVEARHPAGEWLPLSPAEPLPAPQTHYQWRWTPLNVASIDHPLTFSFSAGTLARSDELAQYGIIHDPHASSRLMIVEESEDTLALAEKVIAALTASAAGLIVVTRRAWRVEENEALSASHHALWALLRVAANEQPERLLAAIDLAENTPWETLHQGLSAVSLSQRWLAARGDTLWLPSLSPNTGCAAELPANVFTGDSRWHLVTGAFGGLGRLAVNWLREKGARRIALLAPRVDESWLRDVEGGQTRVCRCDVGDAGQLATVLDDLAANGGIAGAIHAAGVLADAPLQELDDHQLAAVFAVKAQAASQLLQTLRNHDGRYLILYSSAAATLGAPGQSAHALACGYLDGLAQQFSTLDAPKTLSVAWGAWGESGRAATPEMLATLASRGMGALSDAEGCWHLEQAVMRGAPWRLAMRVFTDKMPPLQQALFNISATEKAATPVIPPADDNAFNGSLSDETAVMAWLKKRIAVQLRLSDPASLHPNQDLLQLGMDSLLFLELSSDIQHYLGVRINAERAWQDLSPHGLTQLICSKPEATPAASQPEVLRHDADERYAPFPLTPIQHAYWLGRTHLIGYGGVACHVLFEWDKRHDEFDLAILEKAWNQLIARHDMLRMVVDADGQQRILATTPEYHIPRDDLRALSPEEQRIALEKRRHELSYRVLPADQWPLFELVVSEIDDCHYRLHMNLDLLQFDVQSFKVMMDDLAQVWRGETLAPLAITFRDYVMAEQARRQTSAWHDAWDYWQEKLPQLPLAPELPVVETPPETPHFTTFKSTIGKTEWQAVKQRWQQQGVTPSAALLTLFAATLERWSRTTTFTLNLTFFNRQPIHPQINQLIGDFTSVTLVDFNFSAPVTLQEQMQQTQQRLWQNMAHSEMNGVEVIRELGRLRGSQRQPLMPVVFTSMLGMTLEGMTIDQAMSHLFGEPCYVFTQTPQVWLDHQVMESDGELMFSWYCMDNVLEPGAAEAMFNDYCAILQAVIAAPESLKTLASGIARHIPRRRWPLNAQADYDLRDIEQATLEYPGIRQARAEITEQGALTLDIVMADDPSPSAAMPDEHELTQLALPLPEQAQLDELEATWRWLEARALQGIAATLNRHGLFTTPEIAHRFSAIVQALSAQASHQRLLRQWLQCLTEREWLIREGESWRCRIPLSEIPEPQEACPQSQWSQALAQYLETCIARHDALFSGQCSPLELLFNEQHRVTDALYRDNPASACLNRYTAQIAALCSAERILEVGAGTAATTAPVLKATRNTRQSYHFTDVSAQFLNDARARFHDESQVSYALFDINQPLDFTAHPEAGYDLIVAVNVLHDASHVVQTLRRLKLLLKAGGRLLIVEATERNSVFQLASVGFIEGLSGYRDFRRRDEKPMLTRSAWQEVLVQAGFANELAWPAQESSPLRQHLLVARSPGVNRPDKKAVSRYLQQRFGTGLPILQIRQREALFTPLHAPSDAPTEPAKPTPVAGGNPALEKQVAELWQSLLSRPVARHHDFFELGGDSLMATRMVAQLNRRGIARANLQDLFSHSTLSDFCAHLQAATSGEDNPIPLCQGDGEETLFVFHASDGDISAWLPLASALNRRVFGLQAKSPQRFATLDQMIDEYVGCIRRQQPHGPYVLAGWSYGAFLAAGAAQRLYAKGKQVRMVLIDPVCRQDFCCANRAALLRLLAEGQTPLALPEHFDQQTPDSQLADFISLAKTAGMVSQNLTLQAAETWLDNIAHLLRLLTEHTPGESVPVPCLMVYAAGRPAHWTPAETEWQGWINNADDAVIEASHWQIMMEAPHVQACAQHITRWLCATSTQPENTL